MILVSDRQTLSRAKPDALRRLARYVGVLVAAVYYWLRQRYINFHLCGWDVRFRDANDVGVGFMACRCSECDRELVEVLARVLQ
jgi:hypothetical protein